MKSVITPRSIVIWFVIVVALYFAAFAGIEYWRHRRGPWQALFLTDATGQPSLVIRQPGLNVTEVRIDFQAAALPLTNLHEEVVFDRPTKPIPFGRRLHEDLVSWPGVQTFEMFGHEIELLPRVLKVDRRELIWTNQVINLAPRNEERNSK